MHKTWIAHLNTKEQVQNFETLLKSSKPVLERLADITKRKIESIDSKLDATVFWEARNPTERVARLTAQRKLLKEQLKLLEV